MRKFYLIFYQCKISIYNRKSFAQNGTLFLHLVCAECNTCSDVMLIVGEYNDTLRCVCYARLCFCRVCVEWDSP